ncbi:MAG: bacteriochlorophyll 4-vinyl reductase [Gemmatimonadaceae bacterium]|nr:bacteriochlorophyll 4-vinyl reductase [Gemmatimonadaceae bacterium]
MSATALPGHGAPARIGPNTIIQVAGVLRDRLSQSFAEAVLREGTPYTLDTMPHDMVDEREALGMVRVLVRRVGATAAVSVLREAGYRTADYLLANRIPSVAQWIIRAAPRRIGLKILLKAMSANAWTFAGSGTFRVIAAARTPELVFESCLMCRDMHEDQPMCDFYAGTFERLIRVLVADEVRVSEVECMAQGGARCRFQLHNL